MLYIGGKVRSKETTSKANSFVAYNFLLLGLQFSEPLLC
jgi:hypothetical protein